MKEKVTSDNKIKRLLNKWGKKPSPEKIILIVFFAFFLVEAIINLYPFLWVINNSLKSFEEFNEVNLSAITRTWEFSNYFKVFQEFKVNGTVLYAEMLVNSMWQTFLYLFVNLFSSLFVAYALAKFRFPGKGLLYALLIFVQTIPVIGTGAAAYKLRYQLGLVNNPALIWICWAVGFDYSAFVMYGTFQGISQSYSESAEIDGANEFDILFKIIFPQIFPCMLALMVTNFVARWNDYTFTQINLDKYPNLAYGMYLYQTGSNWSDSGIIVATGAIVLKTADNILYALIVVFVSTKLSELILVGLEKSKLCIIICNKGKEVAEALIEKSPRGVTMLDGEGMYKHENRDILLTCVKNRQLTQLRQIVHSVDESAFVIINDSVEVRGKGFTAWEKDL